MYPMPLGYHRYVPGNYWRRHSKLGAESTIRFKFGTVAKTSDGLLRFEDHRDLAEMCRILERHKITTYKKDKKNLTLRVLIDHRHYTDCRAKYRRYFSGANT